LIQTEVIDEMADLMGVGKEIRKITEKAMNGEMNFDESLKQRVAMLKGLTRAQMQNILDKLPIQLAPKILLKRLKVWVIRSLSFLGVLTFCPSH
jgi:phosphoserine phosphatase